MESKKLASVFVIKTVQSNHILSHNALDHHIISRRHWLHSSAETPARVYWTAT